MSNSFMALLCLLVIFTSCKTTKDSVVATSQNTKLENTLLWKIEGKNIKPSYLFGTIHLIAQEDFFINPPTEKAFETTEQLVLEVDMDDPNLQMEMMSNVSMAGGMTLDKLLSEEDYKKTDEFIKSGMGMGVEMFKTWQPMLLTGMIAPQFIEGSPASYEASLVQFAKESNKEVLGLETIKEQIGAMGKIDYKDQANMIMEVVNDLDAAKDMFSTLVSNYKSQNVTELQKLMVSQSGGIDIATALLDERNKNWIPRIGNFAKDKSTFFAVGSGHLGGKNGVIQLLRNAGYSVTAVTNSK